MTARDTDRPDHRSQLRTIVVVLCSVIVVGTYYLVAYGITDAPAEAPRDAPAASVDLADPFRDSPVARYADGAAGIVTPEAHGVGPFTEAEVQSHLDAVARLLVLSRLDARMLEHRDPTAFVQALAPSEGDRLATLLAPTSADPAALTIASRLAPDSQLLPAPVKVKGEMSYDVGPAGEFMVRTNYVFVYPLRPVDAAALTAPDDVLLVVHADQEYALDGGGWVVRGGQGTVALNADCEFRGLGLLALPRVAPEQGNAVQGDPYDPGTPVAAQESCPG